MALPSPQTDNETPKNNLSVCPEVIEPPKHPWRRYFARVVDSILLIVIPKLLLGLIMVSAYHLVTGTDKMGVLNVKLLEAILRLIVLIPALFMETFLLQFWGTTVGKRLFGLKVRNAKGQKLSFGEALKRTACLYGLLYIVGFFPLFALIVRYIQLRKLMKSGYTTWDQGNRNTVGL